LNGSTHYSSSRKSRQGFTLIELLVVIAIIAILAAILFPVFAQAREKARAAACLSNTKQIGLGLMQYVQDYDEVYPGVWMANDSGSTAASYNWRLAVEPYVKSVQVFKCPSNRFGADENYYRGDYFTNPKKWYPNNYVPNQAIMQQPGIAENASNASWAGPSLSLAAIDKPADTILIAENKANGAVTEGWNVGRKLTEGPPKHRTTLANAAVGADEGYFQTHNKMTHFIFADGHAKAMRPDRTLLPEDLWQSGLTLQQRQSRVNAMPVEYR